MENSETVTLQSVNTTVIICDWLANWSGVQPPPGWALARCAVPPSKARTLSSLSVPMLLP